MTKTLLDKTRLGARGPEVSRLCLGTMMFGDQTDQGEAAEIIARYAEAGGNFIDTADQYAGGASERIIGRAIGGDRGRWVIASKGGNPVTGVTGSGGLSALWLRQAIDQSLDRIGVDKIDLYYLHLDDEETRLEETIGAVGEMMDESGVKPSIVIRTGEPVKVVREYIGERLEVAALVLGAAPAGNPGPLVANFTGNDAGKLPCPVMIIPGSLDDDRLEQLS